MSRLPFHLLPDTAAVDGAGELTIGGLRLTDLAGQFGTPLFVYDEAHIRRRCREAVDAFGGGVAYASKAFLCLAIARLVHDEGMCIDVASDGLERLGDLRHVGAEDIELPGQLGPPLLHRSTL